jgi:hypothetical protein
VCPTPNPPLAPRLQNRVTAHDRTIPFETFEVLDLEVVYEGETLVGNENRERVGVGFGSSVETLGEGTHRGE